MCVMLYTTGKNVYCEITFSYFNIDFNLHFISLEIFSCFILVPTLSQMVLLKLRIEINI